MRFIFLMLLPILTLGQGKIKGLVVDANQNPIAHAQITIEQSSAPIFSDNNGEFEIDSSTEIRTLIIRAYGFEPVKETKVFDADFTFSLDKINDKTIETIVVVKEAKSTTRLRKAVTNTQHLSQKELQKAACCNLAESFETNPSIDVNISDAVTGNKQIKMLGLNSPYILMSEENTPAFRGPLQSNGMSFVPGTWVESIQITKGAGSVVNGYESISGQINYELLKPEKEDPFFVNLYGSTDSRYELNTHFRNKYSDKLSSLMLVHASTRNQKMDMNHDHFIDNPVGNQINLLNRWKYEDTKNGIISIFNIKYFKDEKTGGEEHFEPDHTDMMNPSWGSHVVTDKIEMSNKTGYVFPDMPFQSIGLQQSFQYNKVHSEFGNSLHHMHHKNYFANLIFNSIITNTKHKFTTGVSFNNDIFEEHLEANFMGNFDRTDTSIGGYFEYTFDNINNFSLVLGNRVDLHNRLGLFYTPRLHVKYNPFKKTTLRFSAGRGKRASNIFVENINLFASSRELIIKNEGGKLYGLNPEIAWNYGGSLIQKFNLFGRENEFVFDYYITDFDNQVVVDLENPRQAVFSNLNGKSYAHSFQVDYSINILTHLDLRVSYKYLDVKTQYQTGLLEKPLQAKHRFFANIAYETHILKGGKQWKFDMTYNWIGNQRLPNTTSNPVEYQLDDYTPAYNLLNAQITRTFSSTFEMYLGGENLGNFKQKNAIVANDNPFGPYFDSTMIYGPVFGRMVYAGLRFKIK